MANDMDFNGADSQDAAFDLIPANTLVKLCLTIRPGGAGPEGWLTQSKTSTALYLNTEAIVLEGPYARRRIYTRIGFRGKGRGRAGRGQLRQPRPRADPGHPRSRRAASGPPTSPRRPAPRA